MISSIVIAAARRLIQGRTRWVVVTSAVPGAWEPDGMWLVVVTRDTARVIRHPRLPADSKGTGDLFNADLAARILADIPLEQAVAQASEYVVQALRHTLLHRSGELLLPSSSPAFSG